MDIDLFGASVATGGLFGLVGNIAAKVFGYVEAKQAFTQKQAEWLHKADLLKLQIQARAAATGQEIRVAESQGSWGTGSVAAEGAIGAGYPWVNAVRALVRPTLTIGLTSFLAAAFFALNPGDIDRAHVADSLVFVAVTSVVWWFGDRAPRKLPRP